MKQLYLDKINSKALNKKVIFIDRDGVIIEQVHHLSNKRDVRLIDKSAQAIRLLNEAGYVVVVITNQTVVGRGLISLDELEGIHGTIQDLLELENSRIDAIYFCPHFVSQETSDLVNEYNLDCKCRKPEINLINDAINDFNIDINQSYFIGDTTTDMQTAKNAHIKSILVNTGYAGKDKRYDVIPDAIENNLYSAVVKIINKL